jgi:predicted heme/steroid binding protein
MAEKASTVRQRKVDVPAITKSNGKIVDPSLIKKEDHVSVLDVFRSLAFLVLASCALSYFVTRESLFWNVSRPKWTNPDVVRAWLVSLQLLPLRSMPLILGQAGPKQYTDADLAKYDGTDESLPILLAINGTIYDVSAGRRHYGPDGSYHFFAGADASRAFVTSCFDVDRNPDMRGVEKMYIPLDNPEVDSLYAEGDLKMMKYLEKKAAKQKVHDALKHWCVYLLSVFYSFLYTYDLNLNERLICE